MTLGTRWEARCWGAWRGVTAAPRTGGCRWPRPRGHRALQRARLAPRRRRRRPAGGRVRAGGHAVARADTGMCVFAGPLRRAGARRVPLQFVRAHRAGHAGGGRLSARVAGLPQRGGHRCARGGRARNGGRAAAAEGAFRGGVACCRLARARQRAAGAVRGCFVCGRAAFAPVSARGCLHRSKPSSLERGAIPTRYAFASSGHNRRCNVHKCASLPPPRSSNACPRGGSVPHEAAQLGHQRLQLCPAARA